MNSSDAGGCFFALLALALLGFLIYQKSNEPPPPPIPKNGSALPVEKSTGRFEVRSQGSFCAGARTREVVIITDTKTGVQYLAITGCGTSELQQQGKTLVEE